MTENHYILLHVDRPLYRYDFHSNHPLILGKNPQIGVKSIFLWYTYPNISENYGNNVVTVGYRNKSKEITIPTGMYEVAAISALLNDEVAKLADSKPGAGADNTTREELLKDREQPMQYLRLGVNESTFKCYVKLARDVNIDFTKGKLHEVLGLQSKAYRRSYEEGTNIINITRGVDQIFVRCNLVERNYQSEMKDVLYDILPYAQPGSAIQEKIEKVEFFPCRDSVIRHIELKITDSKGNLIDLAESMSIKLCFRSLHVENN